jgi:hypothetical protein
MSDAMICDTVWCWVDGAWVSKDPKVETNGNIKALVKAYRVMGFPTFPGLLALPPEGEPLNLMADSKGYWGEIC